MEPLPGWVVADPPVAFVVVVVLSLTVGRVLVGGIGRVPCGSPRDPVELGDADVSAEVEVWFPSVETEPGSMAAGSPDEHAFSVAPTTTKAKM